MELGRRRRRRILPSFIKYLESQNITWTFACRRRDVRRTDGPSRAVNVGRGSVCVAICKDECWTGPTYITNGPWGWGIRTEDRVKWHKGVGDVVGGRGPIHPRLQVIHQTTLGASKGQLERCSRRQKPVCQMLDTIPGIIWRLCTCV